MLWPANTDFTHDLITANPTTDPASPCSKAISILLSAIASRLGKLAAPD